MESDGEFDSQNENEFDLTYSNTEPATTEKNSKLAEVIFCQEIFEKNCCIIGKSNLNLSEKLFSCELCSGTFRYGSHLRKHQGIHNEHKVFQESRMQKFKGRIQTNPTNTMSKLSKKQLSCDFCSGTFRYGSHLRTHEKIHTGYLMAKCLFLTHH